MKSYLSIFMKSPESGKAKTRLLSLFSRENVARLYEAFVKDTLEKLSIVSCDVKVICYLGKAPSQDFFSPEVGELQFWPQVGIDLGERMRNYFERSFTEGAGKSVVIGSDSPTLPTSYLEEAFSLLELYEVVVGPSLDGGYYLIGMRKNHPELFENMTWSHEEVFQETIVRNRHLEGKVGLLGPWYDVDTPEGLQFLKEHLQEMRRRAERELPQRTYRLLSELEG